MSLTLYYHQSGNISRSEARWDAHARHKKASNYAGSRTFWDGTGL